MKEIIRIFQIEQGQYFDLGQRITMGAGLGKVKDKQKQFYKTNENLCC